MPKQIDINDIIPSEIKDIIPSEIKDDTRRFIDTQYQGQDAIDALPPVRNRHEGYGLLAEGYVGVKGAVDNVNAAMRDCLKSLSGTDGNFQDAASNLYNALLDTCIAVPGMGVQALNVIYRIQSRPVDATPLEELAAEMTEAVEDADELPDVSEEDQ